MYEGSDLGAVRTRHGFSFTVWSPAAESARLLLFHDGQEKEPYSAVDMKEGAGRHMGMAVLGRYAWRLL